jgi:hypothetical protein
MQTIVIVTRFALALMRMIVAQKFVSSATQAFLPISHQATRLVIVGATIRFALVQRTNTVQGSSGVTAYVPVFNSIAQTPSGVGRLKVTVFRSG